MHLTDEQQKLADIASQKLREPARAFSHFTRLLREHCRGCLDPVADAYTAVVLSGTGRMQQAMTELLSRSRIATSQDHLRATSCENALRQAVLNLRAEIEDSHAQVTRNPLPELLADECLLVHLFQSFISDAIQCSPTGAPQIHFDASAENPTEWLFSVRYRASQVDALDSSLPARALDGSGAPDVAKFSANILAICKKIVRAHGGSLWVHSRLGDETTFNFTWPHVDSPSTLPMAEASPPEVFWSPEHLAGTRLTQVAFRAALDSMRSDLAAHGADARILARNSRKRHPARPSAAGSATADGTELRRVITNLEDLWSVNAPQDETEQ